MRERHDEAHDEQARAGRAEAGDEARPGAEADDADEDGEPDGVEHPERRLGMRPNVGRTERSQPKTSPMIERAAAGREAQRQVAHRDGEQRPRGRRSGCRGPRRPRRSRSRVARCSRAPARPLDVVLRAGEPQQVAAIHDRARRERDLLAAADELQKDHTPAVLLGDLGEACDRATVRSRHDHVERGQREIEQLPVLDLVAEAAVARRGARGAGRR